MKKTIRIFIFSLIIISLTWGTLLSTPVKDSQKTQTFTHGDKKFTFPPLRDINVPPIQKIELPSGMKIFLMEDHQLPVVKMFALIRTGEAFDPKEVIGLASLTMDQIRSGGIPDKTGDELDEMLDRMGASITTGSSETSGSITTYCLAEDMETILHLLKQIITSPRFAEDKLELIKTQLRSAISRRNDDPGQIADREFRKLVYGADSPYARQMEYEHVNRVARDDLMSFHRRFFKPQNIYLGIWGDFSPETVNALIEKTFGKWEGDGIPAPPFPEVTSSPKASVNLIVKKNVNQSQLRLGHLGIEANNPDYFAVEVMNNIFGTNSFLSRLMQVIRTEKGLTYGISGGVYSEMLYPDMTRISTFTKSERTGEAIDAIIGEIKRIQDSLVEDEEMETAKSAYLNGFVFNFASTYNVLRRKMRLHYYGYPEDFLEMTKDRIVDVTREDVRRVAQKYLHPDELTLLVVGKPEDFDKPLSNYGKVNELDITIPEPPADEQAIPELTPASLARGKILLDRAVEVMKANEKIADLRGFHFKEEAKITFNPQMKFDVKMETWVYLPNKVCFKMSSDMIPQLSMTQVVTGNTGWAKSFQGIKDYDEAECRKQLDDLEKSTLVLLRNSMVQGFKAQYLGEEEVKGKTYETVYIRYGDNKGYKVYLDSETGHIGAMAYSGKKGPEPGQFINVFGSPIELGGIIYPSGTEIYFNGDLFISSTLKSLELNPEENPDLFKKPETK